MTCLALGSFKITFLFEFRWKAKDLISQLHEEMIARNPQIRCNILVYRLNNCLNKNNSLQFKLKPNLNIMAHNHLPEFKERHYLSVQQSQVTLSKVNTKKSTDKPIWEKLFVVSDKAK